MKYRIVLNETQVHIQAGILDATHKMDTIPGSPGALLYLLLPYIVKCLEIKSEYEV